MIAYYNKLSFFWGVPGFILQIIGVLQHMLLVQAVGVALLMIGIAYYAKSRGRGVAWCLLGIVPLGIFLLLALKDNATAEAYKLSRDDTDVD